MRHLLGLARLHVEDAPTLATALRGYEAALEFADAAHLAARGPTVTAFASFDRALAKMAPVVEGTAHVHRVGAA